MFFFFLSDHLTLGGAKPSDTITQIICITFVSAAALAVEYTLYIEYTLYKWLEKTVETREENL